MREDGTESSRHFEILLDGFVLSYGAVSTKETIEDMKVVESRRLQKEVLRPQSRAAGYISVTEKTGEGLKVEFAIVHCVEEGEGDPDVRPALVDPTMSTVYLNESRPLEGPEEAFRAFLATCIKSPCPHRLNPVITWKFATEVLMPEVLRFVSTFTLVLWSQIKQVLKTLYYERIDNYPC